VKTKNSPESLQNKQPLLKWTMPQGKKPEHIFLYLGLQLVNSLKDGDCWPLHPGQSLQYSWIHIYTSLFPKAFTTSRRPSVSHLKASCLHFLS